MNRPVVVLLIAALTGASAPLTAQQEARGPCDLLSAAEIAKFLAVSAVQLDSVNTGTNEFTKVELCSWFVALRDPRGVTLKLRGAHWHAWPDGTGGALIVRSGTRVLTITGTVPKATAVAMAKAAVARL